MALGVVNLSRIYCFARLNICYSDCSFDCFNRGFAKDPWLGAQAGVAAITRGPRFISREQYFLIIMIEEILCRLRRWVKSLKADHALKTVIQSQPAQYLCCVVFVCIGEDLRESNTHTEPNFRNFNPFSKERQKKKKKSYYFALWHWEQEVSKNWVQLEYLVR